jgi:hypothetical protein
MFSSSCPRPRRRTQNIDRHCNRPRRLPAARKATFRTVDRLFRRLKAARLDARYEAEVRKLVGRLVEQVMTSQPYASAKRVFWVVDNGSSHLGQASVESGIFTPSRSRPVSYAHPHQRTSAVDHLGPATRPSIRLS